MTAIHESDGVATAVEDALRITVTAAANLGRHLANKRASALHAAAVQNRDAEARVRAQTEIDRLAMHAKLAPINQPRWWQNAQPAEVLDAWTIAVEWRDQDPQASRAATRIRSEFAERHGIDLHEIERSIIDPAAQQLEATDRLAPELASALCDYQQARRVTNAAGQRSVHDLVAAGGPDHQSRAANHRRALRSTRQAERGR